jgi:hypothetical protein
VQWIDEVLDIALESAPATDSAAIADKVSSGEGSGERGGSGVQHH